MSLPVVKVEVEFTAGVWTDITQYVDYRQGWTEKVGRTSPLQAPQVSGLTIILFNPKGRFTPGVQVLTDGTAAPYWPNVVPGKQVRTSDDQGVTWVGDITAWQPSLQNGVLGQTQLVAVDRLGRLGRVEMQPALPVDVLADQPAAWWPLTDPAGSTQGVEISGHNGNPFRLQAGGGGVTPTFGDDGPGTGEGTGVLFSGSGNMYVYNPRALTTSAMTVEFWFRTAATSTSFAAWTGTRDGYQTTLISVASSGAVAYDVDLGNGTTYSYATAGTGYKDDQWHHLALVALAGNADMYLDGVQVLTGLDTRAWAFDYLAFGQNFFNGHIGQVVIYPTNLSSARVQAHYNAGHGWPGETVDQRIARFLGYAGLTSADWDLDPSTVTLNSYSQAGKDIASACQEMAATESGGAVFYVDRGIATFRNRDWRPTQIGTSFTVDANDGLSRDQFTPSTDLDSLINTATVQQATATTTAASFTAVNQPSVDAYGTYTGGDGTSYADDPADVQHVAEWIVGSNGQPAFRLGQVTVDLLTTSGLFAATLARIGNRFTVTDLPAGVAPRSEMDFFVEGWTRVRNTSQDTITFDTSPRTWLPLYDMDATGTGMDWLARWQAGALTLSSSVTATATTLIIAVPSGEAPFTTDPTSYPFDITIGAEVITLNSVPTGGTATQTFTGVTRGAQGTRKAAQPSGSPVALAQLAVYTL